MRNIKAIEPWIANFIKKNKIVVLRDKKTHKALGASYTEDGLKWISNKSQRLLYYRNARLAWNKDSNKMEIVGKDMRKNFNVYVEEFVPRNFKNPHLQSIEYRWVDKALRLCYVPSHEYNHSVKSKIRREMEAV